VKPLLRALKLSKSFGTLSALQRVSLEVYPGEVVGLAGESGSGKSVLTMLLAGFRIPDEGEIYFEGRRLSPQRPWTFSRPSRARALGIEVIHQTPDLAEELDITSNVFLGSEIGWPPLAGWLRIPNRRRMDVETARILEQLDVTFSVQDHVLRQRVANLSGEQRQMIAIARAMTRPAKLIIIDDPTPVLSYSYQQKLLVVIQTWQQEGTAVLFSSNNLDHLLAVTDRIIVLRQGRRVAEYRTDLVGLSSETSAVKPTKREEIMAAMVGTTERRQLTPIIWALDSYYRAREQAEKLRYSQRSLQRERARPNTLKGQIIDQLAEQINALDSANVALQDAQRRLLKELEQERKSLARAIHDQVIQDLLGVSYHLEGIGQDAARPSDLKDELGDVRDNISLLIEDLRRICGNLRPPTIDSLGLNATIKSYTRDWTRQSGIPVTLDLDDDLGRLPEDIELSVFRIIQEGLINVRKHARASTTEVCLRHTSPRTLMVSIADDGRGLPDDFDLSTPLAEGHYGLLGISERVALLGGRLKFQNQPGGGLLIQAEIPHPRLAQSEEAR
jgi:signal transduction histidine kinase